MEQDQRPVPVKTILVTIGLVLATAAVLYLVRLLARIEMLLVISLFFAVVLTPLVDRVHDRMRIKRGLAVGLVFVLVIAAVALMMFIIIKPLVTETREFASNFPTYLSDARAAEVPSADWSSATSSTSGTRRTRTPSRTPSATPAARRSATWARPSPGS